MCVKVEIKVFYHASFVVEVSENFSIIHTLNSATNFAQEPELLTTEMYFLTLNVAHLQSKLVNKVMINK